MSTSTGVFGSDIRSLSPEILLKIFLYLDSHETVILRSVSKEFLEIIDNNKSLWRILEWVQQEKKSPIQALEMFDEKSGSTLRQVSIFQKRGISDDHILKVLDRSKNTLTDLSLKYHSLEGIFRPKLIELASNSRLLNSLVFRPSENSWSLHFPKTRPTRRGRQFPPNDQRSSNLQVLWYLSSATDWYGKLDVSSLVSFAADSEDPIRLRSILDNFSQTLVHLSSWFYRKDNQSSLSCPNLSVLEGHFPSNFPSWLDAPNLQIVIASFVSDAFIQDLPVSVQELWFLSSGLVFTPAKVWEFLPLVCPKLKVIKLEREMVESNSAVETFLAALRLRQKKVKEGAEIKAVMMVLLEKLVIPTELFAPAQLNDLKETVGEVIDLKDYPGFIEIEY